MKKEDRLAVYDDSDNEALAGRQWINYAIGCVVISASNMDVALGNLYGALLRTDLSNVVGYGQPFESTRTACLAALDALPAHETYDLVRDALRSAKECYEDRNEIAHGLWSGEEGSLDVARGVVRYRRHGRTTRNEWTQKGLMLLAGEMIDLADRMDKLSELVRLLRPLS